MVSDGLDAVVHGALRSSVVHAGNDGMAVVSNRDDPFLHLRTLLIIWFGCQLSKWQRLTVGRKKGGWLSPPTKTPPMHCVWNIFQLYLLAASPLRWVQLIWKIQFILSSQSHWDYMNLMGCQLIQGARYVYLALVFLHESVSKCK